MLRNDGHTGMFPPTPASGPDELAAESALAAIGLEPWLRAEPKFGGAERMKAAGAKRRVAADIMRFLSGEPVAVGPVHPIVWQQANALLYPPEADADQQRSEALTKAVRDPRLSLAIHNVAARAVRYLQDKLPRIVVQSLAGDTTVKPSALDWARFRDVWEVAAEPETILRALSEGSLTPDQVEAAQALYPALYSEIQQAAVNGVVDMRAKRPRWKLSPQKERQLGTLRQVEIGNLALGADIQAVYAGKGGPPQPTGAAPGASPKSLKTNTASRETPGQRSEEPVT